MRQLGQRERRGRLTVSPSIGSRWMATFENEPTTSPKTEATATVVAWEGSTALGFRDFDAAMSSASRDRRQTRFASGRAGGR